jgi:hypothetical protein
MFLANGGLHTRLGLHLLNTEQRGTRIATKVGWAGPNGQTGLGLSWAGSGPVLLPAAHLDILHLAPFVCVILRSSSPRSRQRDLYA